MRFNAFRRAGYVGAMVTCGLLASTATAQSMPDKIEKIGLMVQDMSNPFFSAMDRGGRGAAEEIGAELNVQDAQLDLSAQYNQIDAFIQQGVDLIIVSAVDGGGIEPAIIKAKEAGIIVIAVDTPAKGADAVIMTDAVQAGMKSCKYLFDQMGGKGQVLLVDGTPIQTIIDRIDGCKKVAEDYPGIKIVGQQSSKNDRASGLLVTTDMLTANPDVTGIFGMNDPSALGAVLAVEQAGKAKQIIVTGVDGSPEAVAELTREGSPFIGTATQNPGKMVTEAVRLAQDMVAGKLPAETTILIPSELVTRDNVGEYSGW
ncbi:ABC transporter substrate-binding protein [Sinorhizobium alkalisoli]|uniref:ABC transporter substrate-binding protein n=1 Tax=Sinorhizobium alkalisoli TaxID=1752398 RepID=UPI00124C73BB|nr:ABC transporter substrate-binding protein [Sinorhizobium alkalisoli]MCG5480944.1 ABC transporter substrate-binding protein [Sinorhizobium alkalisoli]QFI70069.1 Ribose ABC transport system, periplasmic ribose-binding protein RbsB [Sinorhizobium alkalisoli]